ncbi:MAG: 2-oxoglutarate dehydrogenase E1 component [Desulfobacterales bacterium]
MALSKAFNTDYIDRQYSLWKSDPDRVSPEWRFFFEGFELAAGGSLMKTVTYDDDQALRQARVESLIYRYRDIGHLLACMDPLAECPTDHPLLSLEAFRLNQNDLDIEVFTRHFNKTGRATLRDIIRTLRETYCRSIGIEYMHLQNPAERRWLQDRMEPNRNHPLMKRETKQRILYKLYQAALFEQFLNKKYIGQARFSLEGGDILIPMLDILFKHVAGYGCREVILGMAHRGRLNVQAHILKKPYKEIFSEFECCFDPECIVGSGDMKYHQGYLANFKTGENRPGRIYMLNNPSHLEAVNPVVEGFVRARQDLLGADSRDQILPVLIHGDAAFAGQGIVSETLNMSQLDGYGCDGTIHIVINNQIGYTTFPEETRSTRYSTDVAKMLMVPIFHVHGEDPEAVFHVIRLAADYRRAFKKDVAIDVVCYRRYGHNEGDEPYYTQPLMYDRIRNRSPLNLVYAEKLINSEEVTGEKIEAWEKSINRRLVDAFEAVHGSGCPFPKTQVYKAVLDFHGKYSPRPSKKTGVKKQTLFALAGKLSEVPSGFSLHPKLKRLLKRRREAVEKEAGIDWANAENLAFASLLMENFPIRLSGQDSARGTFSQRHSVLVDMKTGDHFVPLNSLGDARAPFFVYNSLLAENGVVAFEYGYSLAQPHGLTIWEAQFGDFVNNAQAIVDLFITSGETKWRNSSGLVMLLPHGWEGLGSEHSSARLERFLQLCADDNIRVCNATTPAQYFHLLRRQAKVAIRKPLIIMTPKSLLRHPLAVSNLTRMISGRFEEVIDDSAGIKTQRSILFCSGKIYYDLFKRRSELNRSDIAIIRLEQFYPFPEATLKKIWAKYTAAERVCWVQEEPENMGGWQFVRPRLEEITGDSVRFVGRAAAATPATAFPNIYSREQTAVLDEAVGSLREN